MSLTFPLPSAPCPFPLPSVPRQPEEPVSRLPWRPEPWAAPFAFPAFAAFNLTDPELSGFPDRSPPVRAPAPFGRHPAPASAPFDSRHFASAIAAMHRWRYGPPAGSRRAWQALSDALRALFASEAHCADMLFRVRWPRGFRCPACRHREACVIRSRRLPLFECRRCRRQTSLTSGTIMERSRTPLTAWFKALFLLSQPCGISAKQLAALLGVTYKTAWLIAHKIRHAMRCGKEDRLLGGLVKIRHMHYGYEDYPGAGHPLWFAASVEQDRIVQIRCQQPAPEHVNANRNIRPEGLWTFLARHVDRRATVTPPEELK